MKPIIIGITGQIGSGKTYISEKLGERNNIPIYNADKEINKLLLHDEMLRVRLSYRFGNNILKDLWNKEYVLSEIFPYPEKVIQLNNIIKPYCIKDFYTWIENEHSTAPIIIMENAVIVESLMFGLFDLLLLIHANDNLRKERFLARNPAANEKTWELINKHQYDILLKQSILIFSEYRKYITIPNNDDVMKNLQLIEDGIKYELEIRKEFNKLRGIDIF